MDFRRSVNEVDDMCGGWSAEMKQSVTDPQYHEEQTWQRLDPELVEKGERGELDRCKKMGGGGVRAHSS